MGPSSFSLSGSAAGSPSVVDVTEATFATEVVERSRQVPVVLDLWAEWCGPCKQLSPVLERLATEAGGGWVLAKVDVDANPRIAQALGVQGIPAVKAIVDGQIAGEFTGALPEAQVRAWLAETGIGSAGGGAEPLDPRLAEALAAEQRGDFDTALDRYRALLADQPGERTAAGGVARIELLQRVRQVEDLAAAVRAADAAPDDVAPAVVAADVELAMGEPERAFARLVDVVRRTSGDDRDLARRHLVALFDVLPDDDPRVLRARRDLASALF